MSVTFHRAPVAEIPALTLYRLLWLRVSVFVVEQEAAYPEIDGRDIEPGAELMWAQDAEGAVLATLRILREERNTRIGRVATSAAARGHGLAGDLMRAAIAVLDVEAPGIPILLDAQAQLGEWYGRFGFVVAGDPFTEDGIPHLPMRRTRLVTERLVLREWTRSEDDRAFLFDLYRRPEVRRYIGDGRTMTDAAEVDETLERWSARADGVLGIRAVTTREGERVGVLPLKPIPWSAGVGDGRPEEIEIGWHVHPDAAGKGMATEAAAAVLALAHENGIRRVVAVTHPDNGPSQAVARRIGMRSAGLTDDYDDTTCALFVSERP